MREGLDVVGLSKRYGDTQALTDCHLHVEPGQLLGFLGPNGAGKSTTMRAVMGLITIDAGSVTWNGSPISPDVRRRFGYMPQERGLYKRMRLLEQVVYFGRLAGLSAADATERATDLLTRTGLGDRLDDELQDLSVGNQQRVQLSVALVHRPELLVLDEPFAGLDPLAVDVLREMIVEQTGAGIGVLFSSHQLDLVQDLCRDVVIIDEGHTIARGEIDDIRSRSDRRVVRVEWADRHDAAATGSGDWMPPGAIERLVDPSGRVAYTVSSAVTAGEVMAAASQLGTVASFRFEPPPLESVFSELVEFGRSERARFATGGDTS